MPSFHPGLPTTSPEFRPGSVTEPRENIHYSLRDEIVKSVLKRVLDQQFLSDRGREGERTKVRGTHWRRVVEGKPKTAPSFVGLRELSSGVVFFYDHGVKDISDVLVLGLFGGKKY